MGGFSSIAEVYDAFADRAGRLDREGPCLRRCLENAPGTRVADIACGTGLHAAWLAALGATVDAFDLSGEMVAFAQGRRPHERITYRQADMRTLNGGPWDLALCLGNSMSLLGEEDGLQAVFRHVREGLAAGGLFLVHLLNYGAPGARQPRHRIEKAVWEDTQIVAVKNLVPEGDQTLLAMSFFVKAHGAIRTLSETAVQRNWTLAHLATAATGAGLTVHSLWGGFDMQRFQPEASPDLLVLFQAPGR